MEGSKYTSVKDSKGGVALVKHEGSKGRAMTADDDDDEEEGDVPVTLVSGFLGAGKTFVIRHLLRHKCTDSDDISPEELRVGVVVGTNADAKLLRRKEKEIMSKDVVRATHSCPCCVEEKLSKDLAALIQQGEEDDHESPIDRVLVECGWASPRTLRNRLQEAKEQGVEDAQKFMVDSMVSVIDASKMQELWESTEILADRPDLDGFAESNLNGPPVAGAENYAKRRVAEHLVEQLECADVVVLTKMELVPSEQRDFIRALLRLLLPPNAGCLVVPVESGKEPSPHLAERVWIDSDWERTVATNTNEDDYKDSVTRARESPRAREELLWWPPNALEEVGGNGSPITVDKCGANVRVLKSDEACRAAVKACEGLEEGSWEFDMMDQRLGAEGVISDVDTEDAIVEVNFGRWDARVGINTFVYTRRRPFHPGKLEAVVKDLPTSLGLPAILLPEPEAEAEVIEVDPSVLSTITRSKGFCWLATFHTAALYWDHSGGHFSLVNIGQWWAATDGGMEGHADEFDGEFGDRRQEIVFIGVHLDFVEIEQCLDECLLNDAELKVYQDHFMQKKGNDVVLPGPLPGMPTHVPTRSPEDQDLNIRGKIRTAPAPAQERGPHHAPPVLDTATGKKASVQSRHDEGNSAFRVKDYKKAVKLYSQAISLCDSEISAARAQSNTRGRRGRGAPSNQQEGLADLLKRKGTLFSNRAECYLRTGNYQKALADCDASLEIDENNDKSRSRKLLAMEKIDDENRKQAEQAETRRTEAEAARLQEEKERLVEAARQKQREEEAIKIEAEIKRQQEITEEREAEAAAKQRRKQQQRDTSAETLAAAQALMADAKNKMRDASRVERQAASSLASVEKRKHELHKKEAEFKQRDAKLAEEKKLAKHAADGLASREAQFNASKAAYRNGIDRRNSELDRREKLLRTREQDFERHRESYAEKDRELKRLEKSLQERTRAVTEREADLHRREKAFATRIAKAKDAERSKAKQQKEHSAANHMPSKINHLTHKTNEVGPALAAPGWNDPPSDMFAPAPQPQLPAQPQPQPQTAPVARKSQSRFFPAPNSAPDSPKVGRRGAEHPHDLCCPITQELMQDPVVAGDGHTYERAAIEDWLSRQSTSPMSNESMSAQLIANHSLKSQISSYLEPHRANQHKNGASQQSTLLQQNFESLPSLGLTPVGTPSLNTLPGPPTSTSSGISLAPGPKSRPMVQSTFGSSPFGDVAAGGSSQEEFNQDAFNQETFGPDAFGSGPDAFGSDTFGQDSLLGSIDMLRWEDNIEEDPWAAGPGALSSRPAVSRLLDNVVASDDSETSRQIGFNRSVSPERHVSTHTNSLHGDNLDITDLPAHSEGMSTPTSPNDMDQDGHDPMAIYVSNINWETTAATLRDAFTEQFGPVAHVNLKENKVRRGPSYAFIIFEAADNATNAVDAGHMVVDGRALKFEARRRTVHPDRSRNKNERADPLRQPPSTAAAASRLPAAEKQVAVSAAASQSALSPPKSKIAPQVQQQGTSSDKATVRLFVGLGGGTTGDEQKTQLTRLFAQYGLVSDVEVGFMGCAFVTLSSEDEAKGAKAALHATTPAISGLARKQGLCVEVATQKGYETALKKAGKPIPPAVVSADTAVTAALALSQTGLGKKSW
jgi:G3E family GTPase